MKRSLLPRRATRRIARAGASVYDWRDQELLTHVDPTGKITRLSHSLDTVSAFVAAAVVVVSALIAHGWLAAAGPLIVLVASIIISRKLPWWPLAVLATTIGASPDLSPLWGGAALLVAALASGNAPASRAAAAAWSLLALVNPLLADVVASIATGTYLALSIYEGGSPFGPLSAKQLTMRLSPPRPRLPWLVALLKKKAIANAPAEIQRKAAGGYGERATALALLGLPPFRRVAILHDAALPGADVSNADHVVLTRAGVFAIDSKVFRGEIVVDQGDIFQVSGGERRSILRAIKAVAWQAGLVADAIGTPTRPVLVIHEANMPSALQVALSDGRLVDVVPGTDALAFMRAQPATLKGSDLSSIEIELTNLGSYDGTTARLVRPLGIWGSRPERDWGSQLRVVTVGDGAAATAQRAAAARTSLPQVVERTPAPVKPFTHPYVQEDWDRMKAATPLPLADLDASNSAIQPGTRVIVLSMANGELSEHAAVAVTPVCAPAEAGGNPRVWIALEVAWNLHLAEARPVATTEVGADRVFIATEGN